MKTPEATVDGVGRVESDAEVDTGGESDRLAELVAVAAFGMPVIDDNAEGVILCDANALAEADHEAAIDGKDAAVNDADAEIEALHVCGRHVIRTAPLPPLEYDDPPLAAK